MIPANWRDEMQRLELALHRAGRPLLDSEMEGVFAADLNKGQRTARLGAFVQRGWIVGVRRGDRVKYHQGPSRSWATSRMAIYRHEAVPALELAIRLVATALAMEQQKLRLKSDLEERAVAVEGARELAVETMLEALDSDDRLLVLTAKLDRVHGVPA